jgi:hypothetical protein
MDAMRLPGTPEFGAWNHPWRGLLSDMRMVDADTLLVKLWCGRSS